MAGVSERKPSGVMQALVLSLVFIVLVLARAHSHSVTYVTIAMVWLLRASFWVVCFSTDVGANLKQLTTIPIIAVVIVGAFVIDGAIVVALAHALGLGAAAPAALILVAMARVFDAFVLVLARQLQSKT